MTSRLAQLLGDNRLLLGLFFGGFLLLSVSITPDYGVYIDVFNNHSFGQRWYDYVREVIVAGEPIGPVDNPIDHDVVHGPIFEMTLAWFGREVLKLEELADWVLFQNYATWATFYLSVVVVYWLARRLGASSRMALLACVFAVLQPRIFSHSFYDSVDISFLAFYVGSVLTLVRYVDRRSMTALSLHAVICAMAIGVRSIGGIIPVITMIILAGEFFTQTSTKKHILKCLLRLIWFPAMVAVTTFATWPFLWYEPWNRVMEIIRLTPQVGWGGTVLYMGDMILATELPWHYLPKWILITTPVAITVLFVLSLIELLIAIVRHPTKVCRTRSIELIVAAATLAPLGLVIAMDAEVYDSWRHLFFIYPTMALTAMLGWRRLWSGMDTWVPGAPARIIKGLGGAALGLHLIGVGWVMSQLHPYQNVYFNRIAGPDLATIKPQFELDFWGLSYIEGLKFLVAHQPEGPLRIFHGGYGLLVINRHVLSPADRARIESVDFEEADYVLTIFRTARQGFPHLHEIYAVERDGAKIMAVYTTSKPRQN